VYSIPGIPDIAPQGISGIHGSRYTHIRLSLTGCRYSEDALTPPITWSLFFVDRIATLFRVATLENRIATLWRIAALIRVATLDLFRIATLQISRWRALHDQDLLRSFRYHVKEYDTP
jgi:hypothetical protein